MVRRVYNLYSVDFSMWYDVFITYSVDFSMWYDVFMWILALWRI